MKKLFLVYSYFLYRLRATNTHGVHSPFVFNLLNDVIYNDKEYYIYNEIETLRKQLLENENTVECIDLGAGSLNSQSRKRSIKHHALFSAKPPKYAQLIFRMVNHFQPSVIIELGTSLGITTAYISKGNSKVKVITIEGCKEIADIARQNFKQLEINNVEPITGNFDSELPAILTKIKNTDFVFFDGNHRKEATLNYFYQCLEKANEHSIFIFDDIYWSLEMKDAWNEIKKNKEVTVSLDLFYMGIIFFRKEQVKQDFVIRF